MHRGAVSGVPVPLLEPVAPRQWPRVERHLGVDRLQLHYVLQSAAVVILNPHAPGFGLLEGASCSWRCAR